MAQPLGRRAEGCGDEAEGAKHARRFSLALLVSSQLRSEDPRWTKTLRAVWRQPLENVGSLSQILSGAESDVSSAPSLFVAVAKPSIFV